MGRHAAPGYGRFSRELASFAFRLLVVAVVFFGAIFVLVTYVPDWLGDGDEIAQPAVEPTTSTTTSPPSSVLDSVISAPTTSLPPVPTTSTTAATTTTATAERVPADIAVLVLNSTSTSGLAASATAVLANLGYRTLEPDNSTPQLSGTQILFSPGFALESYTLAAQFPDGEVLQNPSADPLADIVVILGTSYVP